jgi:hypothetical protein
MRRVVNATREHEVIRPQSGLLDPLVDGVWGCWCDLELDWPLGLVLHDDGARRHLVTVADVPDPNADRVAAARLLWIPRLKRASSRTRSSICKRTRSAQTSLSLNGAFWPTILPLFHGSRRPALTLDPMMDSHQVKANKNAPTWCLKDSGSRQFQAPRCRQRSAFRRVFVPTLSATSGHPVGQKFVPPTTGSKVQPP